MVKWHRIIQTIVFAHETKKLYTFRCHQKQTTINRNTKKREKKYGNVWLQFTLHNIFLCLCLSSLYRFDFSKWFSAEFVQQILPFLRTTTYTIHKNKIKENRIAMFWLVTCKDFSILELLQYIHSLYCYNGNVKDKYRQLSMKHGWIVFLSFSWILHDMAEFISIIISHSFYML